MAECIVGDITPNDGFDKAEKHRREKVNQFLYLLYKQNFYTYCIVKAEFFIYQLYTVITLSIGTDNVDPYQMPQKSGSDQSLHCLQAQF